jgi:hypothetical protein
MNKEKLTKKLTHEFIQYLKEAFSHPYIIIRDWKFQSKQNFEIFNYYHSAEENVKISFVSQVNFHC